MAYNLTITERAEELLDDLFFYLVKRLKNEQAGKPLLSMIEKVYDQLEENPYVYRECDDSYLRSLGYREAIVPEMNYIVIFEVENDEVTILGIFHQLENYPLKL